MERLYSFVDVAGDWKGKIGLLESVIIKIAEKTRECAEFIQKYASGKITGALWWMFLYKEWLYLISDEGRMVHQTFSDTDATISSLSGALLELEGELRQAVIFYTTVVAHGTRDNVDRLRKKEQ
jgi:hypothetical protein